MMRSPINEKKEISNLAKGGNLCAMLLVVYHCSGKHRNGDDDDDDLAFYILFNIYLRHIEMMEG